MFSLTIDRESGVPLYRQIVERVWAAVAAGEIAPGAQLPTVRSVAVDLAINPNTVAKAYRELELQGVLETQQGTGTFVGQHPQKPKSIDHARELDELCLSWLARAAEKGFTVRDLLKWLKTKRTESEE